VGVVFNHGNGSDYSHLTDEGIKRIDLAANLFKKGAIKKILCVGGNIKSTNFFNSKIMKEYLINEGIPDSSIFYDSLSNSTLTNWSEAKKIINHFGWKSVLIISSPFHIYRISKMIKEENLFIEFKTFPINEYFNEYNVFSIYNQIHLEWIKLIGLHLSDDVYNYFSNKWKILKRYD
jgi:uncharacterized SAM-binding protein YcdF (DUF218 family)